MNALKKIGQVIAAIGYSCLLTGLLYLILVLPLGWIMSLSFIWRILVILLVGSIIEVIIFTANAFLLMPYYWIVKKNFVAYITSILVALFSIIYVDVFLWRSMLEIGGRVPIFFAIVITLFFLQAIGITLMGITTQYRESLND